MYKDSNFVMTEGDINNDGTLDKVFYHYHHIGDSMYIFLSKQDKTFDMAYSGKNFSEDGVIRIDTISINKNDRLVEIYLKEIRLERLTIVYKIKYTNSSFYLMNIQTKLIIPEDEYIKQELCDTALNIEIKNINNSVYYYRDKINKCETSILNY